MKHETAPSTVRTIMVEFPEATGLSPAKESEAWIAHRHINVVMFAASLGPLTAV